MSWCAGLFSFSACFWSHPNFYFEFGMIPASYKMRHIIFDGWRKRSFSAAWIFHELHTCSKTTIFGVKFRSFNAIDCFCIIFGWKIQIFWMGFFWIFTPISLFIWREIFLLWLWTGMYSELVSTKKPRMDGR